MAVSLLHHLDEGKGTPAASVWDRMSAEEKSGLPVATTASVESITPMLLRARCNQCTGKTPWPPSALQPLSHASHLLFGRQPIQFLPSQSAHTRKSFVTFHYSFHPKLPALSGLCLWTDLLLLWKEEEVWLWHLGSEPLPSVALGAQWKPLPSS